MSESDEALMVQVAEGSEEAFHSLVMRFEAKARRYCYRIFREVQVAEDVAQEVFLKLYRNADKYEPTGKFTTYFYRVLANHCYDRIRFENRRALVRGTTMDGVTLDSYERAGGPGGNGRFDSPERALLKKEEREVVRAAVTELPENLRRAIVLREFEGLKYREIAEVMQVSLSEVKVLIHRGRKQLAKRLEKVLLRERRP
ncbi:MAG: RNA polymerase sigma factor [Planctomycetota bacterium]